jgi:hypothetical protein
VLRFVKEHGGEVFSVPEWCKWDLCVLPPAKE